MTRDPASCDRFWLKGHVLGGIESLLLLGMNAGETVEYLEAALDEFRQIADSLNSHDV